MPMLEFEPKCSLCRQYLKNQPHLAVNFFTRALVLMSSKVILTTTYCTTVTCRAINDGMASRTVTVIIYCVPTKIPVVRPQSI